MDTLQTSTLDATSSGCALLDRTFPVQRHVDDLRIGPAPRRRAVAYVTHLASAPWNLGWLAMMMMVALVFTSFWMAVAVTFAELAILSSPLVSTRLRRRLDRALDAEGYQKERSARELRASALAESERKQLAKLEALAEVIRMRLLPADKSRDETDILGLREMAESYIRLGSAHRRGCVLLQRTDRGLLAARLQRVSADRESATGATRDLLDVHVRVCTERLEAWDRTSMAVERLRHHLELIVDAAELMHDRTGLAVDVDVHVGVRDLLDGLGRIEAITCGAFAATAAETAPPHEDASAERSSSMEPRLPAGS